MQQEIFNCLVCGSVNLSLTYKNQLGVAVSSDCRALTQDIEVFQCDDCCHVQKLPSEHYLKTVEQLYQSYDTFMLNDGKEQLSFDRELPFTRSQTILNNCKQDIIGKKNVLDLGCGSGVMLKALNQFDESMNLYGFDVSEHEASRILAMPQVKGFFSGDLSKIKQKFDLIVLSHVLEHITEPIAFIGAMRELLSDSGVIIVQVPNLLENPIDILVYDHVSHFTVATLSEIFENTFTSLKFPDKQVHKEITLLLSNSDLESMKSKVASQPEKIQKQFEYIQCLEKKISQICEPVLVFSTGPAGTLVGGMLKENLQGFLDEDSERVGKIHLGTQVKPCNKQAVEQFAVILPFSEAQNTAIQSRLPFITMN